MMEQGYAQLFTIRGVPLRAHFTLALGLLWVGGFQFVPGAWLGYFVLIAMHELGHALLVRRYGLRVFGINIHGFGGECVHQPARDLWQSSVIAWGGVLMQLVLFAVASVVAREGPPRSAFGVEFLLVLQTTNLMIAAINLLPLPGLDGGNAWKLPGLVYRRFLTGRREPNRRRTTQGKAGMPPKRRSGEPNLRLVRDERGDFKFENDDDDQDERR